MIKATVKSQPCHEPMVEQDRLIVVRWLNEIFGAQPLVKATKWADRAAYRVLVHADSQPASYLRIFDRTALFDGRPVRLGGVSGVMTIPAYRHRGYAGMALAEAKRIIFDVLSANVGLLLCEDRHRDFYPRYGWQSIDCPVEFDQPEGKRTWPGPSMILAKNGEEWSPAHIDLCGLPW
ncbi:GNAT family N-acetyltransferase [Verrucomicrobiota bacterium]